MSTNTVIRARIDEGIKDQAASVLADVGLTVSDAIRIILTRTAKEKRFPIDLVPNTLTISTMEKSKSGEDVHSATSTDDLFDQLEN